jgi:hypothetical protein
MVWTSLFGILTVVLLARALGFAKAARLRDAGEAARIAADALPGFSPAEAVVADDGAGALVAGRDGRVALIRSFGDRWVVRIANGAAAEVQGATLRLKLSEAMFPPAELALGPAAASWAARL